MHLLFTRYTIHYHYTIHCIDYICQNQCLHFHCFHHYCSCLPEVAAWIGEEEAVMTDEWSGRHRPFTDGAHRRETDH